MKTQIKYKTEGKEFIILPNYTEEKYPDDYSHPSEQKILKLEKKLGNSFQKLIKKDQNLVLLLIKTAELNSVDDIFVNGDINILHYGATSAISYKIEPHLSQKTELPKDISLKDSFTYKAYELYLSELKEKLNYGKGRVDTLSVFRTSSGKYDLKIDLLVKKGGNSQNEKQN